MIKKIFITSVYAIFFILLSCKNEKPTHNYSNSGIVKDYIYQSQNQNLFLEVDKLKWNQNHSQAISKFEKIIQNSSITIEHNLYGINQIIYSLLFLKNTELAKHYIIDFEKKITDNPSISKAVLSEFYFNKGKYLKKTGDGKNAIVLLQKSIKELSKIYPPHHLKIVQAQCELGESYRLFTHQIDSFLHFTNLAFQSIEKNPILQKHAHQIYLNKANTFRFSRDYVNGLTLSNRAIQVTKELPFENKILLGKCHHTKAHMLKKMKRRVDAEIAFKQAVQLGEAVTPTPDRLQEFYSDLMVIYIGKKDSSNFFKYFKKMETRFELDSMRFANANRLMGFYHFILGDLGKSKKFYLKTLNQLENEPYPDVQILDETFFILTEIYQKEGDYENAIHFVIRNLIRGTQLNVEEITWERLQSLEFASKRNRFVGYEQLGSIYLESYKQNRNRLDHLEKAFQSFQVVDKLIFKNESVVEEDALLKYLQEVGKSAYANAILCSYYLFLEKKDTQYLDWVNIFMERTKFSLLFRDLLSKIKTAFPEVPDTLRSREQDLNSRLRKIKSKLATESNSKLNTEFNKLSKKQNDLYKIFKKNYPRYYDAKVNQKIPSVSSLQQLVKKTQQPIIQFHLGEQEDFVLAIATDTVALLKLERDEKLSQHLHNYRLTFDTFSIHNIEVSKGLFLESSYEIFKQYIEPLFPILKKSKSWIVIPSGSLGLIPFESMLTERISDEEDVNFKNLPYLFNDFSIQYAHSTKTYFRNQSQKIEINKKSKILAYAYSEDKDGNEAFSDLPGTSKELQFLEEHFSSSSNHFRYGEETSKSDFLKQCENEIDILHLALHADSDFSNRLNNKIIFHSNRSADSTAFLFGYEIIPLQINASLVVLSACKTAFGKIMDAEGAYTITRAFLQAGAKNIIATLWNVEDFSNAEILPIFYEQMLQGKSPQEALTEAKRLFLKNSDDLTAHPIFWAGVICYEG